MVRKITIDNSHYLLTSEASPEDIIVVPIWLENLPERSEELCQILSSSSNAVLECGVKLLYSSSFIFPSDVAPRTLNKRYALVAFSLWRTVKRYIGTMHHIAMRPDKVKTIRSKISDYIAQKALNPLAIHRGRSRKR